jgi:DNA recombination protein RmuC
MFNILFIVFGMVIGVCIGYLLANANAEKRQKKATDLLQEKIADLTVKNAELSARADERNKENESLKLQAQNDHKVIERLKPFEEKLSQVQKFVGNIEKEREEQYAKLSEQLKGVSDSEMKLLNSTKSLEGALKSTTARGTWGEIELERVLELSGLKKNIDYESQKIISAETNAKPDVTVVLPGNKHIAIDAKTSFDAYLKAKNIEKDIHSDEFTKNQYNQFVKDHITSVKRHIQDLGKREYWKDAYYSPDFTIMFIPNESMIEMAFTNDPTISEYAYNKNILIASPTTLLGILKSVAAIWKYFEFEKNAMKYKELAQKLFDSLGVLTGHITKLGKSISSSASNYDTLIGSYQERFLSATKKVKELEIKNIEKIEPTNKIKKEITKAELIDKKITNN